MAEPGDHSDIDGLAAEYVLGTLESDEKSRRGSVAD